MLHHHRSTEAGWEWSGRGGKSREWRDFSLSWFEMSSSHTGRQHLAPAARRATCRRGSAAPGSPLFPHNRPLLGPPALTIGRKGPSQAPAAAVITLLAATEKIPLFSSATGGLSNSYRSAGVDRKDPCQAKGSGRTPESRKDFAARQANRCLRQVQISSIQKESCWWRYGYTQSQSAEFCCCVASL